MAWETVGIKDLAEAKNAVESINPERRSVELMVKKALFIVAKIKDVRNSACNILKQEMLANGGEVAVAEGMANCTVEKADVLIMGTLKQWEALAKVMRVQAEYIKCEELAQDLEEIVEKHRE